MKPPAEPPPENVYERVRYAEVTHAMALDLFTNIFPPWRWRKWWRDSREVKRRIAAFRASGAK